ncbi:MAG: hypothetical protein JRC92_06135 [Deltaproteobacteria bacterium]|nr:hypothetical protein [Deltaproteobacteria bacterium]
MPTEVNDLVLVHVNDAPAFFARIEAIAPDVKPNWWQLSLLVLQVPVTTLVWILRDAYIQGDEFTMGGTPMRLEKVVAPEESPEPNPTQPSEEGSDAQTKAQIISLAERRKK